MSEWSKNGAVALSGNGSASLGLPARPFSNCDSGCIAEILARSLPSSAAGRFMTLFTMSTARPWPHQADSAQAQEMSAFKGQAVISLDQFLVSN